MNAAALFLVTHGSSDRRSWLGLQNLVTLAQSQSNLYIGGGCLEGQPLTLAQQLEQFATIIIDKSISEVLVLPVLLLAGVHVTEDIPAEIAIAQSQIQAKFPNQLTFRITPHLGTASQIPSLLVQHFEKYVEKSTDKFEPASQGRILISHGSRRALANHVIEDLAQQSQAIAAYWGVEPKIETQIENLLVQGINRIYVLPYFLTEGGITEIISNKLSAYSDRAQIQQLPVPLSNEQIVELLLTHVTQKVDKVSPHP
jgi:sirohydrochlorin ferrochelatase